SDQRAIALDHLETMLEHSSLVSHLSLYLLCLVQCWCEPLTTGKCEPAGHMYDIIAVFIGAFIGVFIGAFIGVFIGVFIGAFIGVFIIVNVQGSDTLGLTLAHLSVVSYMSSVGADLILYISMGAGLILYISSGCGFDTLHLQWIVVYSPYISMGAGLILYISSGCGFDTHLSGCGFDTLHLQWVLV
ncbi:hypothetical protein RRG08_066450, partial [Elysia crispata]